MCCRCLRDIDPDSVFAYNTPKIVRVKDRYLGVLRLVLLSIVAAYILVKVLYLDEGYNISDSPIGSVRISLLKHSITKPAEEPYCLSSPEPWPFEEEADIGCQTWDEYSVRYPLEEVNGIFITTRALITVQKFKCGDTEDPCEQPWVDDVDPPPQTVFIAGFSNMTLGFKHSFFAPQFSLHGNKRFQGSSTHFEGRLLDLSGNEIAAFPPTFDDYPDIVPVSQILSAGGVDLSSPSADPANSHLYAGAVILVLVTYQNPGNGAIRYTYRVEPIVGADYKLYEVRWNYDGDTTRRKLLKRAGPKFIFIVTGTLTMFEFQTLLVQLVSAMGLLSLAALLVEFCMLYVMPLRQHYSKVKFEETEDFSDVRDEMNMDVRQQSSTVNGLNAALLDLRETGVIRDSEEHEFHAM